MKITQCLIALVGILAVNNKAEDPLLKCLLQTSSDPTKLTLIRFKGSGEEFIHGAAPWSTVPTTFTGSVFTSEKETYFECSFQKNGRSQNNRVYYTSSEFLKQDGEEAMLSYSAEVIPLQIADVAKYSPAPVLAFFNLNRSLLVFSDDGKNYRYTLKGKDFIYIIEISKTDYNPLRFVSITDNPLFGDVTDEVVYSDFKTAGTVSYPASITTNRIGGRLVTKVAVDDMQTVDHSAIPADARISKGIAPAPEAVEVFIKKWSENILIADLKGTDDRSLIVNFKDFIAVLEAPLSVRNGELLIEAVGKVCPGKPIRYFVFGHHHPDYISGIRAFINVGAKVLCATDNVPYVKFLYEAPHTIHPDKLAIQKKELLIDPVQKKYTVSDDSGFIMEIYNIGLQSSHTNDYLIYYFPSEKLLFEDDLAKIPTNGASYQVNKRQAGLYDAIKELRLDVDTIIQAWPVTEKYNVKTIFTMVELKQSVQQ
jgi:glyoxylase-like metal-dependent hydrolase (beta-lactamase superfamily II)